MDPVAVRHHRETMIEIGRRIWARGFAAGNDGNLSIRLSDDRFLATATGSIKGFLTERDLVVVNSRGETVDGDRAASSEMRMHLAIYAARSDVGAVAHAHPPTATGFATAGVPLDLCVLPEVVATLGSVPTVPYGTPSTDELVSAMGPHLREGRALLLANHGVVAYDTDLETAYHHLERVEHFARILFVARMLGNVQVMSEDQVERLMTATGQPDRPITCHVCGSTTAGREDAVCLHDASCAQTSSGAEPDGALVDEIVREVRRQLRTHR